MDHIKSTYIFVVLIFFFLLKPIQAFSLTTGEANIRADNAIYNLINRFWDQNTKNFINGSGYWYYAQAIDAAVMAEVRKSNATNQNIIDTLISSQKARGFIQQGKGRVYYDDENWMAMALIRASKVRNKADYLNIAQSLFADVMSAEIIDEQGQSHGVWWNGDHTQVATASNMGPVITAVMLYQETHETKYLDFAKRVYAYWFSNMVMQPSWQVIDHYDSQGKKEAVPLTYNQGLAVGAAVALYQVTGSADYLTHATGYAQFVLDKMTNHGILVETVCVNRVKECRLNKDLVQFKGITYRYLVKLALVTPQNTKLVDMLNNTAESLWTVARDPVTGLYAHEWDGEDHEPFNVFPSSTSAALALGAHAQLLNHNDM